MDPAALQHLAWQIQLDLLAARASSALAAASVPHALLKGPSTARWLYHPPRSYSDVDLLVPARLIERAASILVSSGVAEKPVGRVGEQASHSLLLVAPDGSEIDLHVTLPSLLPPPRRSDGVWPVLARHLETLDLDGTPVPVLDVPARCVLIALHAIGSPSSPKASKVQEDLRRARAQATDSDWAQAFSLAEELGCEPLVRAGLSTIEPGWRTDDIPRSARLLLSGGRGRDYQLARLAELPLRDAVALVLRELFPSRAFLAYQGAEPRPGFVPTARAHLSRWRKLLR